MRSRHGDSSEGRLNRKSVDMVPSQMQDAARVRTQGLLLKEEEASIEKLQVLGEVVQLLPSDQYAVRLRMPE